MGVILINMLAKKAGPIWFLITVLLALSVGKSTAEDDQVEEREAKVLPIFQVVKFPNDICKGSSKNGTCYTSEECSSKGGTNEGSCASGFGVCCVFALSCGKSSSENQTYLVQASTTSLTSPCTYTICKADTNICRIRFDFTTFVLASAVTSTVVAATSASAAAASKIGSAVGDCVTDQFSISSPGNGGTPIICGTNGGYHMIVDASAECVMAAFNIGGSTSTSRKWNIRVTQYACGDWDMSGWPGCLQYYTSTASTIQNFGFPTSATAVTSKVTHLSNQKYDICIRRASGYCYICYSPKYATASTSIAAQSSFGLSVSKKATTTQSMTGTLCTSDYLVIPYGNTAAIAAITSPGKLASWNHNFCGRVFSIADSTKAATTATTICSNRSPFTIGVNFDSSEVCTKSTAKMATVCESNGVPGGIVGFQLIYFQQAC